MIQHHKGIFDWFEDETWMMIGMTGKMKYKVNIEISWRWANDRTNQFLHNWCKPSNTFLNVIYHKQSNRPVIDHCSITSEVKKKKTTSGKKSFYNFTLFFQCCCCSCLSHDLNLWTCYSVIAIKFKRKIQILGLFEWRSSWIT